MVGRKKKTVKQTHNFVLLIRISNDRGEDANVEHLITTLMPDTAQFPSCTDTVEVTPHNCGSEMKFLSLSSAAHICGDYSPYRTSIVWGENNLISESFMLASHNWITDTVNMRLLLLPLLEMSARVF